MQVFRNVCPRNCYCSCSILSYVEDGRLLRVGGDPQHGFTRGNLCAKGYAYPQRVYHPQRVIYPLKQIPRGSGNWERISWEDALGMVARKILEIKGRYGTFTPVCLNWQSGNYGVLHHAPLGFFSALGATVADGNACWSAGLDALKYTFGSVRQPDPENMALSELIVIWGGNPAWTAVHQMHFIEKARSRGAKLVVIDPILTATAARADLYLGLKPGSDGALALGVAKELLEKGWLDVSYIERHIQGWAEFKELLASTKVAAIEQETGLPSEAVTELALYYAESKPVATWLGMGVQRNLYGGQNIRAIAALAAVTGNVGLPGGGVYYASMEHWSLLNWKAKYAGESPAAVKPERTVSINNFAGELQKLEGPPVKLLWISCRDLFQDAQTALLGQSLQDVELIVQVDQFLNRTSQFSDLFLPATTQFEEWDLVFSYWHYWVGLNQPAIKPRGECRSDLEITLELSRLLNILAPGSSRFPAWATEEEWLEQECSAELYQRLGIKDFRELKEGPKKLDWPRVTWSEGDFNTPSGKIELGSFLAAENGLPLLPAYQAPAKSQPAYPYNLLTPHLQAGTNSQFMNLEWLSFGSGQPALYLNVELAASLKVREGDLVRLYNQQGEVILPVKITARIPVDTLLCYEGWFAKQDVNLNRLIEGRLTDMGNLETGQKAVAFYTTFVNLAPL